MACQIFVPARKNAVRHGEQPVTDFTTGTGRDNGSSVIDVVSHHLFERAMPCLFPYGEGGSESPRAVPVSFPEHVRWCLRYHDRRFRTNETFPFVAFGVQRKRETLSSARMQMKRSSFQRDARILSSMSVGCLEQAQEEESRGLRPYIRSSRSSPVQEYLRSGW